MLLKVQTILIFKNSAVGQLRYMNSGSKNEIIKFIRDLTETAESNPHFQVCKLVLESAVDSQVTSIKTVLGTIEAVTTVISNKVSEELRGIPEFEKWSQTPEPALSDQIKNSLSNMNVVKDLPNSNPPTSVKLPDSQLSEVSNISDKSPCSTATSSDAEGVFFFSNFEKLSKWFDDMPIGSLEIWCRWLDSSPVFSIGEIWSILSTVYVMYSFVFGLVVGFYRLQRFLNPPNS